MRSSTAQSSSGICIVYTRTSSLLTGANRARPTPDSAPLSRTSSSCGRSASSRARTASLRRLSPLELTSLRKAVISLATCRRHAGEDDRSRGSAVA
ncbi:hypothetical protein [Nocardiopsis chromatogenes]|uniref:hypothetical protein n=1 Tax=Nocardiopsis chromatogenes TaxID=280239 RepID=UPI00036DB14C|nr:hypothetical protein [Nocardiopsis chromatogenes]